MEQGTFNPSRCEIKEAELIPFNKENKRTYDISLMITEFAMSQSLNLSALTGTLEIYDGAGLLQNIPLRGEEELRLTIFCYDKQTQVSLNCQVYKIDGVEPRDDLKGVAYTLHWITKTSYEASKRSLIKAFDKKHLLSLRIFFNNIIVSYNWLVQKKKNTCHQIQKYMS